MALAYSNGHAFGTVNARGRAVHIGLVDSPLTGMTAYLKAGVVFNMTITNQSNMPSQAAKLFSSTFSVRNTYNNRPTLEYIQINDTVLGTNQSVDPYLQNVTYNFSVSKSALLARGIDPRSITVMKFVNNNWQALPTKYLGGDATSYNFSAISDSLSTYAISYTADNTINTCTTAGNVCNVTKVTMPSGFYDYYYTGAAEIGFSNVSFVNTAPVTALDDYGISGYSSGGGTNPNGTYAGHTVNSIGSHTDITPSAAGDAEGIIAGIGANLLFSDGTLWSYSGNGVAAGTYTYTYNVVKPGSFTIIDMGDSCGFTCGWTSTSIPPSCTYAINAPSAVRYMQLLQAVCQNQAVGTYNMTMVDASGKNGQIAAAYVWAPYNVVLDDNPSTAGNIIIGSQSYTNAQTANLLGTGSITANAMHGYVFDHWTVSNSITLQIDNISSPNANLSVAGAGTVTAYYSVANTVTHFTETGLPVGADWQVTYHVVTNSSTTNTISFLTNPGNFFFNIPDVTSGTTVYSPTVPQGNFLAGGTKSITFISSPLLKIQFNPTFAFVDDNITATAQPTTGSIEIEINGVVKAGPVTNTVTYDANTLTAGTYTIESNDITSGATQSAKLHVNNPPANIDWLVPVNLILPSITYSTNTVLSSDIFCGNLTIGSAVTLTTNGYSIICAGKVTNNGNIITGTLANGGAGGSGGVGSPGGAVPNSYAGSGAGGGGDDSGKTAAGGNGGATLAAGGAGGGFNAAGGVGASPAAPSPITNANVIYWYENGIQNYLSGAGGGGGAAEGHGDTGGSGGGGGEGILIEANTLIAGKIITSGSGGGAITGTAGGGGGGGGGAILLAYGSGGLTTGTYTDAGGTGSAGSGTDPGGNGGSGNVITYQYSSPPIPVVHTPAEQMLAVNSIAYKTHENTSMNNVEFFYANGTIMPSWFEGNVLSETQNTMLSTSGNNIFWLNLSHGYLGLTGLTVYMGFSGNEFGGNYISFLSNTVTGESPILSATYAQYDDGVGVFPYYQAWGGLSALPSNWIAAGTNIVFNGNSLEIAAPGLTKENVTGTIGVPVNIIPLALDSAIAMGNLSSSSHARQWGFTLASQSATVGNYSYDLTDGCTAGVLQYENFTSATSCQGTATVGEVTGLAVYTGIVPFMDNMSGELNYFTHMASAKFLSVLNFSRLIYGVIGSSADIYWTRVRFYNYTAPTVQFASLETVRKLTVFIETGLTSGQAWNVIYDGVNGTSTTNTIIFYTDPGNYSFTVNTIAGFTDSPASGKDPTNNTETITFTSTSISCTISITPTNSLAFGTLNGGKSTNTDVAVTDNNLGATNTYAWVSGGNWLLGGSFGFGVSNTMWDTASQITFTGTPLTLTATNTNIPVASSGSNSIYFGVQVPSTTSAGTYNQLITVTNVC